MKRISKIVTMLLACIMLFSLVGCGKSDTGKALYGTWSMDVDLSQELNRQMGDDFAGFDGKLYDEV